MYSKKLMAGWGEMDFNSHMRNTAYLDKSADIRMMFLRDHGFAVEKFAELRFGSIVMKDELEYFREISLLEEFKVTLMIAGLSDDGSRLLLRNEFFRNDGKLAARVTSMGGWLSLKDRKLIIPPDDLLAVLTSLAKTDDFRILPSSIKKG
jgi:acyl-CoA thioester hydrolase